MSPNDVKFSSLSPEWQHLIRIMQRLNFGCLENLEVVDGIPKDDGSLITVAEFRYTGDNGACPEFNLKDFILRREMVDFIEDLKALNTMTVKVIHVKRGLPFKMEVENLV